jgi:CRP-like cAMP-binding protein
MEPAVDHPTADDLARVPLLADLDRDTLQVLADRFEVEEFDAGRQLVAEGRAGYSFYLLDGGAVSVTHDGVEIRKLGPGHYFGEIAILGEGRRTATVTATEPGVAWSLFGTSFPLLEAEHPGVAAAMTQAMTERLAAD